MGHLIKRSERADKAGVHPLTSWSAAVEGGSHEKGIDEERER
jgi:hypothetical protein